MHMAFFPLQDFRCAHGSPKYVREVLASSADDFRFPLRIGGGELLKLRALRLCRSGFAIVPNLMDS